MNDYELKILHAALGYAADGYSVFPLWQSGVEWHGVAPQDTKDPTLIEEYWTGPFKGCQIGIRTGRASNIWLLNSQKHPAVDNSMDVFKECMEDRLGPARVGPYWMNELGYNFVLNTLPDDQCPTAVLISDGILIVGDGGFVVPPKIESPERPHHEWEHGKWFGLLEFRRSAFADVPYYVRNTKNYVCEHMPNRVANLNRKGDAIEVRQTSTGLR